MNTYIEINGDQYAATIAEYYHDHEWNNRESKTIKLEMSYDNVVELFKNDVKWFIVHSHQVIRELPNDLGELIPQLVIEQEKYDNSEYSMSGPITDHRDGTITIKMGKPKAEEILAMLEGVL